MYLFNNRSKPVVIQQYQVQVLTITLGIIKVDRSILLYMGFIFIPQWSLFSFLTRMEVKWNIIAFSWKSVNMSLSSPSSRPSFSFLIYTWFLTILFASFGIFLNSFFCFKLTGNFIRCLHYYSVIILPHIPLVLSSFMFSSLLASFLGHHTDLFRYPNIFFLIINICVCMIQSPFLTIFLFFSGIFTMLI